MIMKQKQCHKAKADMCRGKIRAGHEEVLEYVVVSGNRLWLGASI